MTRWANLSKKDAKRLGLEGFRELDQLEKKEKRKAVKKMTSKQFKKDTAPTEYEEQIKLAEYLDMKGYLWCHVPNGGNRDAKTGAKMKRQGVKPGVPDVLIFENPMDIKRNLNLQSSRNIAIELKRENGSMSDLRDTQREWLQKLQERGWFVRVAFGADEAIDWLESLER
jgi:SOS response regulatory protein OraA/RecX